MALGSLTSEIPWDLGIKATLSSTTLHQSLRVVVMLVLFCSTFFVLKCGTQRELQASAKAIIV